MCQVLHHSLGVHYLIATLPQLFQVVTISILIFQTRKRRVGIAERIPRVNAAGESQSGAFCLVPGPEWLNREFCWEAFPIEIRLCHSKGTWMKQKIFLDVKSLSPEEAEELQKVVLFSWHSNAGVGLGDWF